MLKAINKLKRNRIMKFAGAWKGLDSRGMVKYVYNGRKDTGETKRRLAKLK